MGVLVDEAYFGTADTAVTCLDGPAGGVVEFHGGAVGECVGAFAPHLEETPPFFRPCITPLFDELP